MFARVLALHDNCGQGVIIPGFARNRWRNGSAESVDEMLRSRGIRR